MQIRQSARPVHPSRLLIRELEARELTPKAAAKALDYPLKALKIVLAGGELPPSLAAVLERVWQLPAQTWLNMQADFDRHPATHGGARAGAGRPATGKKTIQIRITGEPRDIEEIQAWIAGQGKGKGAVAAAQVFRKAIAAPKAAARAASATRS